METYPRATQFTLLFLAFLLQGALGYPKGDSPRIYKGHLAEEGQFPYMAWLYGDGGYCSGSIISVKTVLTAEHCVSVDNKARPPDDVGVGYGKLDYDLMDWHPVEKVVIRGKESHDSGSDIAVVVTKDPMPDNLATASIPAQSFEFPIGQEVYQIGWGSILPDGSRHNLLRYTKLRIAELSLCLAKEKIHFTKICVEKINGSGICSGDSGGPGVVITKGGTHVIIGTAWYVWEDCYTDNPQYGFVDCKFSAFSDWVQENGVGPFKIYNGEDESYSTYASNAS